MLLFCTQILTQQIPYEPGLPDADLNRSGLLLLKPIQCARFRSVPKRVFFSSLQNLGPTTIVVDEASHIATDSSKISLLESYHVCTVPLTRKFACSPIDVVFVVFHAVFGTVLDKVLGDGLQDNIRSFLPLFTGYDESCPQHQDFRVLEKVLYMDLAVVSGVIQVETKTIPFTMNDVDRHCMLQIRVRVPLCCGRDSADACLETMESNLLQVPAFRQKIYDCEKVHRVRDVAVPDACDQRISCGHGSLVVLCFDWIRTTCFRTRRTISFRWNRFR